MSRRVQIRPFVADDGDALFPLVERLAEETSYRGALPLDKAYVLQWLQAALRYPAEAGLFVAEADGQLVGMCLGDVGPAHHFLPHWRIVRAFAWWVVPEVRGSSVGSRLLLALKRWGQAQRVNMLSYGRPLTTREPKPGMFEELIIREEITYV